MKLRLRSNTIRLRLLEGEVNRLAKGDTIRETLPTPRPFHFAVKPTDVSDLLANFDGDTLEVEVPKTWAAAWALNHEEVGRSASANGLQILIEKDWACTTPRSGEENFGTFPNPSVIG